MITFTMFAIWVILFWLCGFMAGVVAQSWMKSRRPQDADCHKNPVRFFVVEIGEDEPIPKKQNGNQTE